MPSPFNPNDTPVSPYNAADEYVAPVSPYNSEDTPVTSTGTSASTATEQPSLIHTFLKGAAAPFEPIVNTAIEAGKQVNEAGSELLHTISQPEFGSDRPELQQQANTSALNIISGIGNVVNSPFTTVVQQEGKAIASQAGVQNPEITPEIQQKSEELGNLATLPFALPDVVNIAKGVGGFLADKAISTLAQDTTGVVKVPEAITDWDKLPIQDYVDKHLVQASSTTAIPSEASFSAYADKPNAPIDVATAPVEPVKPIKPKITTYADGSASVDTSDRPWYYKGMSDDEWTKYKQVINAPIINTINTAKSLEPQIQNTSTSAKEIEPQTGVSNETATQLSSDPATNHIQTSAPNAVNQSLKTPLTPPPVTPIPSTPKLTVNNILAGEGAIKGWWNNNVNQNTILSSYARSFAKEHGIDFGQGDILEKSPIPTIQHLSERGNMTGLSYIGDGASTSVQRIKAGTNATWEDTATKPVTTILKQAQDGGATIDQLSDHMKARTALNDYANIKRIVTDQNAAIVSNKGQIATLRQHLQGTAPTQFNYKYDLKSTIDNLTQENKNLQKSIRELGKKQSIMPEAQAQAIVTQHANNSVMKQFATDMNKLHDSLLQDSVTAGRISQEAANRMRNFHPDYVPLWRDVDDYGFDIARGGYFSNLPTGYIGRDISNVGASQINVLDNITHNIMNSTRKNDNFMLKGQIFNFLHNSEPDAWQMMFREPIADVNKALNTLQTTDKPHMSAVEVTPPNTTKVENYDKVKFPVGNGKTIELSPINKNLFESVAQPLKAGQPVGPLWRAFQIPSRIVSAMFTKYNPSFAPFNAVKAVMDSAVSKVGMTLGKDFIPGVSQVSELARGILDKDFYDKFTFEYGFGNKLNKMWGGMSDEQIAHYIEHGNIPEGILKKIDSGFADYNNRFDIATRSLQYRVLKDKLIKQGLSPDAAAAGALSAAKDIHLNFQNTGANTNFNNVLRTIPFSRVYLTSVDKVLRQGVYAAPRIAGGLVGMFAAYHAIQAYNDTFKNANGQPIGTNGIDPDILKEYTIIRTGTGPNDYIKLPLGWMLTKQLPNMETAWNSGVNKIGQLFHANAEKLGNKAIAQESFLKGTTGREFAMQVLDSLFGYITPKNLLPALAQPFYGAATNRDSLGHSIVPDSTLQEPAFMQHSTYTDSAVVDLTNRLAEKGISISPARALYYIREFTGNLGTTATIAGAHLWDATQGHSPAEMEPKDIPIVGRYIANGSAVPDNGVEKQFNNIYRNLLPIVKTEAALAKQAEDYPSYGPMLQQFREDHAEELLYAKRFEDVNKNINNLQKEYAKIVSADSTHMAGVLSGTGFLGDSGKRQAIDANRIQQLNQMQAGLEWLHMQSNNGDFTARNLYSNRDTHSVISQFVNNITQGKPQKPLDIPSKIKYNNDNTPDTDTLKTFLNAVGQ